MKADIVWWWRGGREVGQWMPATIEDGADECAATIERMGYVAVKGLRSIGPPEGAPSEERFKEVEKIR